MKNETRLVLIVLLFSVSILLISCRQDKAEQQRTIEEVDRER